MKQEVAKGLLCEGVRDDLERERMHTTFVSEPDVLTDSGSLSWDDDLNVEVLERITKPQHPLPLSRFATLARFLDAFGNDDAARIVAKALGIDRARLNTELRDRIHTQMFGPGSSWSKVRDPDGKTKALVEPFFVIEAKTVLEHVTDQAGLFVR